MKLLLAALPLYLGPLLAGMAGLDWAQVPVFACLFLLWLVVMRPQDWPREAEGWRRPQAWAALAGRLAVQFLLVAACFGIGRGIGLLTGTMALPGWLPLAVSALAIPLARLLWNPAKQAAMEEFLDDALAQIDAMPGVEAEDRRDVSALLALPDGAGDAEAVALLSGETGRQDAYVLGRLRAELEGGVPGHAAIRRGAVLWTTDPAVAGRYLGYAALGDAFALALDDPAVLALFATRARALLKVFPDAAIDFPGQAELAGAAADADLATAALLLRLRDELARVDPAAGG